MTLNNHIVFHSINVTAQDFTVWMTFKLFPLFLYFSDATISFLVFISFHASLLFFKNKSLERELLGERIGTL